MPYPELTRAKLAERYGVSAPAMRKALVDTGLADPDTGIPTPAGHLHGGARYVEREIDGTAQRWPVWEIDAIDLLFPALATGANAPAAAFKDRFKAMDALTIAGGEINTCFPEARVRSNPDLFWLEHAPGHGSLMGMDDAPSRKRWAKEFLRPLHHRVEAMVRRSRSKHRDQALVGVERIAGVLAWLSGDRPPPIAVGDPLPPHPFGPVSRTDLDGAHRVDAADADLLVMRRGFVLESGGDDADIPLYEAFVSPLQLLPSTRLPPHTHGERACLTVGPDEDVHLLVLHVAEGSDDWHATAWDVVLDAASATVRHAPSMTCRLPIRDRGLFLADVEGPEWLASRAAGLVPTGRV